MQRIFYLYRITNFLNGKIYLGVHAAKNIDDGYFCSSEFVKADVREYGRESFKREILEYFDTELTMYARERELVNTAFVRRSDTYNKRQGGKKGWNSAAWDNAQSPEVKAKRQATRKAAKTGQGESNTQFGSCWIKHSTHDNKKIKKDELETWLSEGWVKGRIMPESWGENIRNKLKGKSLEEIVGPERAATLKEKRRRPRKN